MRKSKEAYKKYLEWRKEFSTTPLAYEDYCKAVKQKKGMYKSNLKTLLNEI